MASIGDWIGERRMTLSDKPIQSYNDSYRRPQRAWLRTGKSEFGHTQRRYLSQSFASNIGNLNRERFGARSGCLVVFRLDKKLYCLILGKNHRHSVPRELLDYGVTHISTTGHWQKAIQGRVPGETIWITTGPGLPRPCGRNVSIIIEAVLAPKDFKI